MYTEDSKHEPLFKKVFLALLRILQPGKIQVEFNVCFFRCIDQSLSYDVVVKDLFCFWFDKVSYVL
jgi:hypothetical protein